NNAANQLRQLVTRDKNRAGVILWSMANETPVTEERTTFLKNLFDIARGMDNTRLITAANERRYINPTTQMIDDPFGEFLDVIGCDEYRIYQRTDGRFYFRT
ncbi:MAG: glycoside hydrolase family 2 TIM barrel-domain containing protein, partial [Acidobacteriota bacterium]